MRNLLSIALLALVASYSFAQRGDLKVTIKNINEHKGVLQVGLYNKSENFPTPGKEFQVIKWEVDADAEAFIVKNIPQGDYAIAVYHDCNEDGECNKNFIGIPTEAYGFSNDARPKLSAPKFDDAKFTLEENTSIVITLVD